MQHNLILIGSMMLVFFSLSAFGQTTAPTKSAHPLMDKYYPRPQKTQVLDNNADTTSAFPTPTRPVTQTSPTPVLTTAPTSNNTVVNPAPALTPSTPAPVEPEIQAGPTVTSTPVSVESANTTISNSNTVTTPAAITVNKPVQQPMATKAAPETDPSSLFTTRLGSSAPEYNTWEKNNDGEGSVTTSPKQ